MAKRNHLRILDQGVEAWNLWREQSSTEEPNLVRVSLRGRNLSRADLHKTCLREADLSSANLSYTILDEADLSGADLSNANLWGAQLIWTDLTDAFLGKANLAWACFQDALVDETNFSQTSMAYTMFADTDISRAVELESVKHLGPSSVGIDTLYRSKGKIPEAFLRGCGAPEDFITYARSLVTNPIEYYSCFISYSSKDKDFADRLHADLQAKAIRCWYAPEDLKIGDKFRTRIEESIRIYDKVMIVLSENSIQSAWVEDEVEATLERERQHPDSPVLFPIRLDDAVMETNQAWAASLRRIRHIGDFSKWKDHDSYQKAFERLLRDLKSQTKPQSVK